MSVCVFLLHIKTDNPLNTFKNHGFRPLFECGCFTSFRFDYDDPKFIELTVLVNQVLTQPTFLLPVNFMPALRLLPHFSKVCMCTVLTPSMPEYTAAVKKKAEKKAEIIKLLACLLLCCFMVFYCCFLWDILFVCLLFCCC